MLGIGSWDDPVAVDGRGSVIALLKAILPAQGADAVTPDDATDLATTARSLYIGGTGDVKVDMADGTTETFAVVPAGTVLPIAVKRVYATGTTATSILALI